MNIGFDLDKVFIDYPFFVPDKLIDRLYKKESNGDLLYRIPSNLEQIIRKASHHPFLRPVIKKNIEFLLTIPKKNNKLYLVSSRFGFLKNRTELLVKNLEFDKIFDGIYFNYKNIQPHLFKNAIIDKLDLDIYVEDDFPLVKYLAKHHRKTSFFWLNNKKGKKMLTRNIFAISNISDILPRNQ